MKEVLEIMEWTRWIIKCHCYSKSVEVTLLLDIKELRAVLQEGLLWTQITLRISWIIIKRLKENIQIETSILEGQIIRILSFRAISNNSKEIFTHRFMQFRVVPMLLLEFMESKLNVKVTMSIKAWSCSLWSSLKAVDRPRWATIGSMQNRFWVASIGIRWKASIKNQVETHHHKTLHRMKG